MKIQRTQEEIEDMLRRVTFALDSTPPVDLFGRSDQEARELMCCHRGILEAALDGNTTAWPEVPMLFEQSCLGWLSGINGWNDYPELVKDEEGLWRTK